MHVPAFVRAGAPKRLLVGEPLRTASISQQLLPKRLALPVFCSDPISSVAYATQEMMIVLAVAGSGLFRLSLPVGSAIAALLVIVVLSYRQTCSAYPNGGGAYVVSRANLGPGAALIAASALLVDYVLTVAVSVAAGVAAVTSYSPVLEKHAVLLSLAAVGLLALANLRGVREAGRGFAVPTYGFVLIIYAMFAVAAWKFATGEPMRAITSGFSVESSRSLTGLALAWLVLRAFSSGCTALTGVEAVSNGVPAFRPPKSRNAAATLSIMGAFAVTMFLGITGLALATGVQVADSSRSLIGAPPGFVQPTVLAQIGQAVFGGGLPYALLQAFTAAILLLAANTAFNGFPVLASILAGDGFLPKQLHNRGDRLVFSNGITLLAVAAGVLLWVFGANVTQLIHLYIIGVFVSFTLSQSGMVRHWTRERATTTDLPRRRHLGHARVINATGAVATGVVLAVVVVTKFTEGAWVAVVAMGGLLLLMSGIRRYYGQVRAETQAAAHPVAPARNHGVVLVSGLQSPTLQTLEYARALHPDDLIAVTVRIDPDETKALEREWQDARIGVPLRVLDSPYRDLTRPVITYVRSLRRNHPDGVVTVFIPEYVPGRWWAELLHNQSALRIKTRLRRTSGVVVTSVPYQLRRVATQRRRHDRHSVLLAAHRGGDQVAHRPLTDGSASSTSPRDKPDPIDGPARRMSEPGGTDPQHAAQGTGAGRGHVDAVTACGHRSGGSPGSGGETPVTGGALNRLGSGDVDST